MNGQIISGAEEPFRRPIRNMAGNVRVRTEGKSSVHGAKGCLLHQGSKGVPAAVFGSTSCDTGPAGYAAALQQFIFAAVFHGKERTKCQIAVLAAGAQEGIPVKKAYFIKAINRKTQLLI